VYHSFLGDARFYALLHQVDCNLASEARRAGCPKCEGRVHSARFPRKPRGAPIELGGEYDWRLSFCCAREGCRRRLTPASVRFLGRKVYLGAVIVLVSTMRHGVNVGRTERLNEILGVGAKTLGRWRKWWRDVFTETPFWRAARGGFPRSVIESELPASLLARFLGEERDRLVLTLRFLSPVTTSSAPSSG
jgi:hypothetical protein